MSFPRYPSYKDSGVEWLGAVPNHWSGPRKFGEISSLKGRLGWQGLKADEYREEGPFVVSSAHFSDFRIRWDECPHVSWERYEIDANIQLLTEDILLMKDGAALGKLAFVDKLPSAACLNSHLLLFRPLQVEEAPTYIPKFAFYYMQTPLFQEFMQTRGTGATFMGVSQATIARHLIVWPQIDEQRSIAAFLDHETAKIDALVAEQERLIELLKEKRQTVISHAVTKGLDPSVPMKDSGVEWLGEVPAHWGVGKCGFYLRILNGFAFPSTGFTDDEAAHRLLRGVNVGVSRLKWDDTVYWQRSSDDGLDEYEMAEGDLVMGMDRPLISEGMRVAKVSAADLPSLLLQRVASLKVGPNLHVDYLHYLLASEMFVAHFSPETTGVSVPHISPDQINNFVVPIPPISEQTKISEHVQRATAMFGGLIDEAENAILLLQERRTALISAAITGQIDVRGWVPAETVA